MCLVVSQFVYTQEPNSKPFIQNNGQIVDQKGKLNSDVLYLFPNEK